MVWKKVRKLSEKKRRKKGKSQQIKQQTKECIYKFEEGSFVAERKGKERKSPERDEAKINSSSTSRTGIERERARNC